MTDVQSWWLTHSPRYSGDGNSLIRSSYKFCVTKIDFLMQIKLQVEWPYCTIPWFSIVSFNKSSFMSHINTTLNFGFAYHYQQHFSWSTLWLKQKRFYGMLIYVSPRYLFIKFRFWKNHLIHKLISYHWLWNKERHLIIATSYYYGCYWYHHAKANPHF